MKMRIVAKCNDSFFSELRNDEGEIISKKDGYVPRDMGIGGGDYVRLTIDLATGKIDNWSPITDESIALDLMT
jgi:hypothetical protein